MSGGDRDVLLDSNRPSKIFHVRNSHGCGRKNYSGNCVASNPQQQLAISSSRCWEAAVSAIQRRPGSWSGLPTLWRELKFTSNLNEFLADALLLVVTVPVMVGLGFAGRYLVGEHPRSDVRAGAVLGAVALFVTLLLALMVDNLLAPQGMGAGVEVGATALVAAGLLYGIYWLYTRPTFGVLLGRLEDNGWFDVTAFKGNQGARVRRGTVIGILVLAVCGVYVLIQHRTLSGENWEIPVPFLGEKVLPILYHLNIIVPLLILVVAAWMAWRIVNWPTFADFLIATEAEMNKVSWTTRKRLIQDTIVVLVTVFLFTVFLFVVDILWVLHPEPARRCGSPPGGSGSGTGEAERADFVVNRAGSRCLAPSNILMPEETSTPVQPTVTPPPVLTPGRGIWLAANAPRGIAGGRGSPGSASTRNPGSCISRTSARSSGGTCGRGSPHP